MHIENIVSFEQQDADSYLLTAFTEDLTDDDADSQGHVGWTMNTYEAVRLHSLLVKVIGPHVAEGEAARAEYETFRRIQGEADHLAEGLTAELNDMGIAGTVAFDITDVVGAFRCDDPEESYAEMVREQADLQRKADKENR